MTENGDKKPRSFPPPPACICTLSPSDAPTLRPCGNKSQDRLPTFRHCTEVAGGWGNRSSFHLFMAVPLSLQQTFSGLVHKKGTKVQYEFKGQSLRKGNYSMTNCRYGTQPCPLPLVPEGVMRGGKEERISRPDFTADNNIPLLALLFSSFCCNSNRTFILVSFYVA